MKIISHFKDNGLILQNLIESIIKECCPTKNYTEET